MKLEMIKATYVIETEVEIERNCYMGVPYNIMQTVNVGIGKLKEEARGNLTDQSKYDIIVTKNRYYTSFNIAEICGITAAEMIRESFPNAKILLSVDGEDADEKIVFRAYVR